MANLFYPLILLPLMVSSNASKIIEISLSPKIVGGRPVEDQKEFGFIVSLRLNGYHICGGSIIDDRHILTAAHCCFDNNNRKQPPKVFSILAGTLFRTANNGTIKKVKEVIVHELYDSRTTINDIALIKIADKFDSWTLFLHPIAISTTIPYRRKLCKVAGWGVVQFNSTVSSNRLLYVGLPIVDLNSCRRLYISGITSEMICAGGNGVDSCQGDSGGPLVCDGTLTGIVSWGSGCGTYPGVYTAVSKYLYWVAKHIGNDSRINFINIYFTLINIIFVLSYK